MGGTGSPVSSVTQSMSAMLQRNRARVRDLMHWLDKDGDGQVTRAELVAALESLGLQVTGSELDVLLSELDKDRSGTVSFREACPRGLKRIRLGCCRRREAARETERERVKPTSCAASPVPLPSL